MTRGPQSSGERARRIALTTVLVPLALLFAFRASAQSSSSGSGHTFSMTFTVAGPEIKAEDGQSDPPKFVSADGEVKLKAVVPGDVDGTYAWTTTSAKIELVVDDDPQTVTVKGKGDASSAVDAEQIKLEFTSQTGQGPYEAEHEMTAIKVEATAFRPTHEWPDPEDEDGPLNKAKVPNDQEESPGAGIRVNGDTETAANENDLVEVELRVEPFLASSELTYVLVRSNGNIKVWDSSTMGGALLDSGTEAEVAISSSPMSVWVESPSGGDADLDFSAELDDTEICRDRIHFYAFTSIVIALGGEGQAPTYPAKVDMGIFRLASNLYRRGYDVHMYDEDKVDEYGGGAVYNEVVSAIKNRGVTQVAIFGYSHGGGSTHDLAEKLDIHSAGIGAFSVPFTAYIDAVENDYCLVIDRSFLGPELRRPPGSAYHVNFYQEGLLDFHGGPIIDRLPQDYEKNVDSLTPTHTHKTIANDASILGFIEARLATFVQK